MVAEVPRGVKWGLNDSHEWWDGAPSLLRCLGLLWLWGVAEQPFAWPADYAGQSIATKELVPIVMACVLWGEAWWNQQIVAHCDNQAVVEVVNAGYCKDPA